MALKLFIQIRQKINAQGEDYEHDEQANIEELNKNYDYIDAYEYFKF